MSSPASTENEEQILLIAHKHWASLLKEAAFIVTPGILILALLLFSRATLSNADLAAHAILTLLLPLCFLIIWIILGAAWSMYYLDALVVTDRRVFWMEQETPLSRAVFEWPIEGTRFGVRLSGAMQSLFTYGSLIIEAPGEKNSEIPDLPKPERISAVILKQGDQFGILKETARRQQELLKFLSHEVKGHLTKSKAAFAAIVEGDFGQVPAPLDSMAHAALADSQKGVETVMSILEGANLERGELALSEKPFDFSATTRHVVEELRPEAAQKKLSLVSSIEGACIIVGDEEKIERHVIRNLIENAIRYTPAGQVDVVAERLNGMARLSIADTGIGISEIDMQNLFTQGGKGEHSREVNPDSTGYGLFIAKQLVERHHGRIWARSEGTNRGSQFFAEFPLAH